MSGAASPVQAIGAMTAMELRLVLRRGENLFATIGSGAPHLVFNGHTDVVPPGDEARWTHPPFGAEVVNGIMYGRGAVDMKGGNASFVAAVLDYLAAHGEPNGTLSLMFTGDEEGPAINGSVKLVDWAVKQGHRFDAGLVGEPTSVPRISASCGGQSTVSIDYSAWARCTP